MPKILRSCLTIAFLVILGSAICVGVWAGGIYIFGLPGATEALGEPAPDLNRMQEISLGLYLLIRQGDLAAQAGDPAVELDLTVEPGQTAGHVIDALSQAGVVHNPELLRLYLRYRGFDRGIEAGRYRLSGSMTIFELASSLQSASAESHMITIPEGWRREQIASYLASEISGFSESAFLDVTASTPKGYSFTGDTPETTSLEGFLFPETYNVDPSGTVEDLIARMLNTFDARVTDELREAFHNQGLSLYDSVILASIVEREAIVAEERPHIAAVFLNRLANGMSLDADPTVQYSLGKQTDGSWWKAGLTLDDLAFESPYNTYLVTGLPPGPIANPGLAALEAVAFPDASGDLYFRALCDGSGRHAFAETFEGHLQNACP